MSADVVSGLVGKAVGVVVGVVVGKATSGSCDQGSSGHDRDDDGDND